MNDSTDNVKTKEQLSDDIKLIKEILNTTSTDFGKSYRIFFVVAALFAIYIIGEYLFDLYAISTLSKVLVSGDIENLVLTVATRILFYYPLVIFAAMYFMKRKTLVNVNVAANNLTNLWGLGIGTVLVAQFLMGFRNQYVAINMQGTDAFINPMSAGLFVSASVLVLLYYATSTIIQKGKVFLALCIINGLIYSVCVVILPVIIGTNISQLPAIQAAIIMAEGQVSNFIFILNLLFMGFILRRRFKEDGE